MSMLDQSACGNEHEVSTPAARAPPWWTTMLTDQQLQSWASHSVVLTCTHPNTDAPPRSKPSNTGFWTAHCLVGPELENLEISRSSYSQILSFDGKRKWDLDKWGYNRLYKLRCQSQTENNWKLWKRTMRRDFFPQQIFTCIIKAMLSCTVAYLVLGFPGGSDGKASVYNAGDLGSIPGLGRSPGEGNGNPLQYSCLENPMDRGAW